MRVLVTRARADALRTAARLAAAGHHAVLAPLTIIVPTGAVLPNEPCDAILATSVHAVVGVSALPHALAGAPWLVVGRRSAEAIRNRGWGEAEAVAADVASLLTEIDARYPEPFAFLYLAGRDRKPDLEAGLSARGHGVRVVETYAAEAAATLDPAMTTALRAGTVDAALHFSRRSATLFVERLGAAGLAKAASTLRHVAISRDAALPLQDAGWDATVAEAPDEEAILAALARLSTRQTT